MDLQYGGNVILLFSLGLTLAQPCEKTDNVVSGIVNLSAEVRKIDNKITNLLERLEARPTVNTGLLDFYAVKKGDCVGYDISGHNVDKETCAVLCHQHCQCVGFVYTLRPEESIRCWLKHEICDTPTNIGETQTYYKHCKRRSLGLLDYYAFKEGTCEGNDISSYDVDKETCAVLCHQDCQCVGFVYTLHNEASIRCWLKREICETPTSMTKTQTYYKHCGKRPLGLLDLYAFKEGDCSGNDISSHDVDKETCSVLCQQQRQCVGFVYTLHPEASKRCWLKREICDTPTSLSETQVYYRHLGKCL
ncbi:unnamed protein product [Owenia fusiformis]|uniref:Apple domain-containing protein n=1 Tax=Owenia fusiformis TaxID=6347 RepID=A0A8S4Q4R1_OWEFU|nr:unnamed protein product [Owenia fusiformis]